MQYLVEPAEPTPANAIYQFDNIHDLTCADLACGSGHILNECFDLLYQIYIEEGYNRRKAIEDIFQYNLTGIDIDTRAKQLATFALLMKACQKDNSFSDAHCMPRVLDMPIPYAEAVGKTFDNTDEERTFIRSAISEYIMGGNAEVLDELTDAVLLMNDAQTLGSIMKFNISERTRNVIAIRTAEYGQQEILLKDIRKMLPYMQIILTLTENYATLVMNPPYMGGGNMNEVLSTYVKENYEDSKADLFSVFMELAIDRLKQEGKYGMINMQSWMFLSSFEKLRKKVLDNYQIDSMLHLGPRTFDELSGEVVQNTAFVISRNHKEDVNGTYFRLVEGKSCKEKEQIFLNYSEQGTKIYYPAIPQSNFEKIPGCPIGYWVSKNMQATFKNPLISSFGISNGQNITGNNNRYIRMFWELSSCNISNNYWALCARGGGYRKYYGNVDNVILWNEEAKGHYKKDSIARIISEELRFKEGITWSYICSGNPSFRKLHDYELFEKAGTSIFVNNEDHLYSILALLNSCVAKKILGLITPTLNFQVRDIFSVPCNVLIFVDSIISIVKQNEIFIKQDWDTHETSWDFTENEFIKFSKRNSDISLYNFTSEGENIPMKSWSDKHLDFIQANLGRLEWITEQIKAEWEDKFMELHINEEELNRQFIEIYGLQDELTPDVPLNEITILQQGEISIENNQLRWHDDVLMKQLISYAVGCMMGRYSIDRPGLILANQGDSQKEYEALVPNSRFAIDDDGIIPLMPANTEFTDNITLRFKTWLGITFGEDSLMDNLNFIERSLGKHLDDYFVKDFWKDHKKMYQNRPIYWLFSSKKGSFQCIAYMHRMNAYTAEKIRTNYLLPHIESLFNKQNEMQANAANLSTRERKELDSIGKQIDECREYHDRLHVVADQQIGFDLDDGVVVNYAKFGDVLAKLK